MPDDEALRDDEDMRSSFSNEGTARRAKGLPAAKIRSPKMLKITKIEIRAPRQRKMRTNYRNA